MCRYGIFLGLLWQEITLETISQVNQKQFARQLATKLQVSSFQMFDRGAVISLFVSQKSHQKLCGTHSWNAVFVLSFGPV